MIATRFILASFVYFSLNLSLLDVVVYEKTTNVICQRNKNSYETHDEENKEFYDLDTAKASCSTSEDNCAGFYSHKCGHNYVIYQCNAPLTIREVREEDASCEMIVYEPIGKSNIIYAF